MTTRNLALQTLALSLFAACASTPLNGVDDIEVPEPQPVVAAKDSTPDLGMAPAGETQPVAPAATSPAPTTAANDASTIQTASFTPPTTPIGSSAPPRKASRKKDEDSVWALSLWNDPRFKRQFTESYVAETEIEPRVTAVEREDLEKILEYISEEKLSRAVKTIQKNRGPASSAAFDYLLGNIHFQNEELEQAMEAYTVSVEKYPKFRRAWRNLALIHVRSEEFGEAAKAFTKVITQGGGDSVTYGLLGFCYANLEDYIAAESAYRMANLLDPETLDWKMGMARTFFLQERYSDASALCKSLIKDNPAQADLWMLQANAYLGLSEPMRAAENFEVVDHLGKSTVESLSILGDIYVNEELYDLASSAYMRAMEKDEDPTAKRTMRAAKVLAARSALDETRMLVEAIEAQKAQGFDDEQRKELLKLRAKLALATGAGDEEARILQEIVDIDPLDGDALLLLGEHAKRGGQPEQAIFYFERAASIERFEADAKLKHGQLLVGEGRYNEALPYLRRAHTLTDRDDIKEYLDQVDRIAQSRK